MDFCGGLRTGLLRIKGQETQGSHLTWGRYVAALAYLGLFWLPWAWPLCLDLSAGTWPGFQPGQGQESHPAVKSPLSGLRLPSSRVVAQQERDLGPGKGPQGQPGAGGGSTWQFFFRPLDVTSISKEPTGWNFPQSGPHSLQVLKTHRPQKKTSFSPEDQDTGNLARVAFNPQLKLPGAP